MAQALQKPCLALPIKLDTKIDPSGTRTAADARIIPAGDVSVGKLLIGVDSSYLTIQRPLTHSALN